MATCRLAIIPCCILGFIPYAGCRDSSIDTAAQAAILDRTEPSPKPGAPDLPDRATLKTAERCLDAGDPLREVAEKAIRDLNLPDGSWRFQNHADTIDSFQGGRTVLVARSFLFRRVLDGVPVYGPGTSIQITVDPAGGVKSLLADWPPSIHRTVGVEAFSHLDLDEVIRREVKAEQVSRGHRLVNLGLCYLSQPCPGGLVAVPVVGVRIVPATPGGQGMGHQFFLPL